MTTYTLKNSKLKIEISSLGAELQSIYNYRNETEYLWQGNPEFWGRRAPHLFPIVGKLRENSYKYDNKIYIMEKHGFARDQEFTVEKQSSTSIEFVLNKKFDNYPFLYEFRVIYKIILNKVKVKYIVNNLDVKPIYFSVGGHPAFKCPIDDNLNFDDYFISFDSRENPKMILLENDEVIGYRHTFIKNKKIGLNRNLFYSDALIIENPKSDTVTLESKLDYKKVEMKYKNFDYLAFWTKDNVEAPFICFEPWCGIDDYKNSSGKIEEKKGIIKLDTEKTFKASYELKIK